MMMMMMKKKYLKILLLLKEHGVEKTDKNKSNLLSRIILSYLFLYLISHRAR